MLDSKENFMYTFAPVIYVMMFCIMPVICVLA